MIAMLVSDAPLNPWTGHWAHGLRDIADGNGPRRRRAALASMPPLGMLLTILGSLRLGPGRHGPAWSDGIGGRHAASMAQGMAKHGQPNKHRMSGVVDHIS